MALAVWVSVASCVAIAVALVGAGAATALDAVAPLALSPSRSWWWGSAGARCAWTRSSERPRGEIGESAGRRASSPSLRRARRRFRRAVLADDAELRRARLSASGFFSSCRWVARRRAAPSWRRAFASPSRARSRRLRRARLAGAPGHPRRASRVGLAAGRSPRRDRRGLGDRLRERVERAVSRGTSGVRRGVVLGVVLGEDEGLSDRRPGRLPRLRPLPPARRLGTERRVPRRGRVRARLAAAAAQRRCARFAPFASIGAYVLAVGWQPSVVRAGVAGALASLAWLAARPRDRWHFLALGALVLDRVDADLRARARLPALVRRGRGDLRRRAAAPGRARRISRTRRGSRTPSPSRRMRRRDRADPLAPLRPGARSTRCPPTCVAFVAAPLVLGLGLLAALADPFSPSAAAGLAALAGWAAAWLELVARVGRRAARRPHRRALDGARGGRRGRGSRCTVRMPRRRRGVRASSVARPRLRRPRDGRRLGRRPARARLGPARRAARDVPRRRAGRLHAPRDSERARAGRPRPSRGERRATAHGHGHPLALGDRPDPPAARPRRRRRRRDPTDSRRRGTRPGARASGPDSQEALAAARERHVPVRVLRSGTSLRSGGLRLDVLWPAGRRARRPRIPIRTRSCSSRRTARRTSTSRPMPSRTSPRACRSRAVEIMKVAHHGSEDPGLADELRTLRPRIAVISCGLHNDYGHPRPDTLAALAASPGLAVYRTDLDGRVVIDVRQRRAARRAHAAGSLAAWRMPRSSRSTSSPALTARRSRRRSGGFVVTSRRRRSSW